jgi:hypothetical protein
VSEESLSESELESISELDSESDGNLEDKARNAGNDDDDDDYDDDDGGGDDDDDDADDDDDDDAADDEDDDDDAGETNVKAGRSHLDFLASEGDSCASKGTRERGVKKGENIAQHTTWSKSGVGSAIVRRRAGFKGGEFDLPISKRISVIGSSTFFMS